MNVLECTTQRKQQMYIHMKTIAYLNDFFFYLYLFLFFILSFVVHHDNIPVCIFSLNFTLQLVQTVSLPRLPLFSLKMCVQVAGHSVFWPPGSFLVVQMHVQAFRKIVYFKPIYKLHS